MARGSAADFDFVTSTSKAGAALVRDGRAAFTIGFVNAVETLGPAAGAYLKMVEQAFRSDRLQSQRLTLHRQIAAEARRKVLASYKRRKPRRSFPAYRTKTRIGYGLTADAIMDSGHDAGTTRSTIQVLDFDLMDRLTQGIWRQINFGANPNPGSKRPLAFPVVLAGGGYQSGFVLQFDNQPVPAGVLRRPRGRWRDAEGKIVPPVENGDDRFYPRRKSRANVPLKGSRATQFVDAGLAHVAKATGPGYVEIFDRALEDGRSRARLAAGGVKISRNLGNVARPQMFSASVRATMR